MSNPRISKTLFIARHTDKKVIHLVTKLLKNSSIKIESIYINSPLGDFDKIDDESLKDILEANIYICSLFRFHFSSNFLTISRNDKLYDNLSFEISQYNTLSNKQILTLWKAISHDLHEINYQDYLAHLGQEVEKYYKVREANLANLENALYTVSEKFVEGTAKQRQQLDSEYKSHKEKLEEEFKEKERELLEAHSKKQEELKQREQGLEKRLKDIDDRDAKHARRTIREEMKKELAARSEKFELTSGTKKLREPIFWFSIVLFIISGSFLVFFSYQSFFAFTSNNISTAQIISILIRQILAFVASGSTAIFFIKWNNRWFEQHAMEEFNLKRLQLDIERASWVVEMALEWKEEKGTEIPKELIDRLTVNLFNEVEPQQQVLHPFDQIASALLRSSAKANINLPGGSTLELDRKGIKKLEEDNS